jgi:hypothetical protein
MTIILQQDIYSFFIEKALFIQIEIAASSNSLDSLFLLSKLNTTNFSGSCLGQFIPEFNLTWVFVRCCYCFRMILKFLNEGRDVGNRIRLHKNNKGFHNTSADFVWRCNNSAFLYCLMLKKSIFNLKRTNGVSGAMMISSLRPSNQK